MMRLLATCVLLILIASPALAQSKALSMPLVGIIMLDSLSQNIHEYYQKLLAGKSLRVNENVRVKYMSADGDVRRLTGMARTLVSENPAVVVAVSGDATSAVQRETRTIPIVSVAALLESGFIDNLARPSGNITGVSIYAGDLDPKRLELLKDIIPSAEKIAVLGRVSREFTIPTRRRIQDSAEKLGLIIASTYSIFNFDEIDAAFDTFGASDARALVILASPLFALNANRVGQLSAQYRLPAICHERIMVIAGCLASYSYDSDGIDAAIVDYVARILAGAKPSDLPVRQPTRFWLAVNLRAAKALGVTVPPSILILADEVIE